MNITNAVKECKTGNPDAFDYIVDGLSGNALRFAVHFIKNIADAEDAVQEAFVQSWKNLNSLKNPEAFQSWFFTILNNICKKSVKNRQNVELKTDIECEKSSQALKHAENQGEIFKYLAELTEIQQKAIILRDVEDFSYAEISTILNIPQGTVKSRISCARDRLRELYTKKEGIE